MLDQAEPLPEHARNRPSVHDSVALTFAPHATASPVLFGGYVLIPRRADHMPILRETRRSVGSPRKRQARPIGEARLADSYAAKKSAMNWFVIVSPEESR